MRNEFVQYTKRKIVLKYPSDPDDIWFSELQDYKAGFDIPIFHVTRSISWPVPEVTIGDVIWLVSQLESPWGKLPPSLDGKIVVSGITKLVSPRRTRFAAGDGSKWCPLHDASVMLSQLAVIFKSGETCNPYTPSKNNLGQAFQSLRRVANPKILDDYCDLLQKTGLDFVSYRIKDGTRAAYQAVSELMKDGRSVFWDRWSLPRRLAERRELVCDAILDRILEHKITTSSVTWGIETAAYADPVSYSGREKRLAIAESKYRPYKRES
jgi:hypothetical protein